MLRAFAILYVIMAVLAVIGGLIGAGWALVAAPWNVGNRIMLALMTLAGSFFIVVGTLAVAEIIKLFIDIEHNTRVHAAHHAGAPIEETATVAVDESGMPVGPARSNRMRDLDEETAEGALLRGH